MGRRIQTSCVLLLVASGLCLLPGAGSMAAADGQRTEKRSPGSQVSQSHPRRDCGKRKGHAKAGRRPCRQKKQRRRAPAAAIPEPVAFAPLPALPTAAVPQEVAPGPGEDEEPEVPKEAPPKEEPPVPPTPRCELVPSPCSIYSDKFWELLAKYKRFEIGTGVYPYHPNCMEAWEEGKSIACAAVIIFLRPDGTLGPTPE